jgi:hypothetical protein
MSPSHLSERIRRNSVIPLAMMLSAPAHATVEEEQTWLTEAMTVGIDKRSSVTGELNQRIRPESRDGNLYLLRLGAEHSWGPRWNTGLGMQYLMTGRSEESRLYQFAEWSNHGFALRSRVEERFQGGGRAVGLRIRERLELTQKLNDTGSWAGKISGEMFWQFNHTTHNEQTGLSSIRGQISLQRRINPHVRLQIAYLYNRAIRDHAEDTVSHVPWITLGLRL